MSTNKKLKATAKLSPAMIGAMLRAADRSDGRVIGSGTNTVVALIDRGMVSVGADNYLTAAAWAWLLADRAVSRPADADRATLAEALELAYPHNAEVDVVDAWVAAVQNAPEVAAGSAGACCGTEFYSSEDWYEHRLTHQRAAGRLTTTQADAFTAGDRVVCGDGRERVATGMTHRTGEPARVVVEGGAEWIAEDCRPANGDNTAATPQCDGHYDDDIALLSVGIGEAVYCDGSCKPGR